MSVKIQHHLKSWNLRRLPRGWCNWWIHPYCEYPVLQQNPKALEAVWDFAMTVSAILALILQLINATSVTLKGISLQQNVGSCA